MSDDLKVEKTYELVNKMIDTLEVELEEDINISSDMREKLHQVAEELVEQYLTPTTNDDEEPLDFYADMDEFGNTEEV